MNFEYAFLCDYADAGQKLTAVGIGLNTVFAQSVPALHPQIFAVIGIRFTANEIESEKQYQVRVQDADGADIVPALIDTVKIPNRPGPSLEVIHNFVNGFYGIRFERFGGYQVCWLIDGIEVSSMQFQVARPPSLGA